MSSSPSLSTASSTPGLPRGSRAAGRVRSNTRSSLVGAWVVAGLWNLVSAPVLVFVPRELERNALATIAFIFPVVGVGLLIWAVTLTLRWRRFGPSWFEMSPITASPGGLCAGTIRTRLERPPSGGERLTVNIKLTCLRRVIRGNGKHRSVRENILWREEQDVPADHILFTPTGTAIPVRFALPADAPETSASKRSEGVFWALSVEASLPGLDLYEDFDVPVRRGEPTEGRPVHMDRPERSFVEPSRLDVSSIAQTTKAPVTRQDLAAAGILVRQTEAGVDYHFGAARNPSFAIPLTVFLLIWTGALWLQIALDAPVIFPLVTGLFELLLLVIVTDLWLGTTTVTINPRTIRCRHTIAGIGATRVMAPSEISKIDLHISMQTTGRSGTPYYEIRATKRNGRRGSLGSGIRNKAHAEWLAREMRTAVGRPT
jgi:hypothetical protein